MDVILTLESKKGKNLKSNRRQFQILSPKLAKNANRLLEQNCI